MDELQHLPEIPRASLHARMRDGAIIVTVNNRLAHHLRGEFEREQLQQGRQAWTNPAILPWSALLAELHLAWLNEDPAAPALLDGGRESLLWTRVVEGSAAGQLLLRPQAAIDQAMAAMRLVCDWQLDRQAIAASQRPEPVCFVAWLEDIEQRLTTDGWLVPAQLPDALCRVFASGRLNPPAGIVLAGFEYPTPAQSALLAQMAASGSHVERLAPLADSAIVRQVRADDPGHEITLAGHWAAARLAETPAARLAIVVPDLSTRRQSIDDGLAESLHPERADAPAGTPEPVFEFSLGLALDRYPLVADALDALTLLDGALPWARACSLVTSPFLGGGDSELADRAQLTRQLREDGRPMIDRRQLLSRSDPLRGARTPCADFNGRLRALDALVGQQSRRQRPSEWAQTFARALRELGWPGERQPNREEQQQQERFTRLLGEFAALDDLEPSLPLAAALRQLRQLTGRTVFQPRGRGAPVQVLGVREAQGQQFDHIWVMGLDDNAWPPPPALNPLLPAGLQRAAALPHSSAALQLEFATRMLERLQTAASTVTLSWSRQVGDLERGPSPLLRGIDAIPTAPLPTRPSPPLPLTEIDDTRAPRPKDIVGDARLLADQSACPFRAVVHHRLHAQEIPRPGFGLESWRVGQLLHRCLQQLWQWLGDHQTLAETSAAERDARVTQILDTELERLRRDRPDVLRPAFFAAEQARLRHLLLDWLDLETQRPAPFTVTGTEAELTLALGELPLKLRLDRVDELGDGQLLVIDYKLTRNPKISGWTEERLRDPQLPLYTVAHGDTVGGAALACLSGDKRGFHGYSCQAGMLPNVEPPKMGWDALHAHWQHGLRDLADEIMAGRADVSPTDPKTTCDYCDLHSVCRIQESVGTDGTAGDD